MRFVLRRLGFFLLTLWAALTLNFVLPRLMPGNPALAILGRLKAGASPQALRVLEQQFGIGTHQNVVAQFIGYVLEHALLPALALLLTTIGTWILTMRNTMITTLGEDYVRMARAKGLPGRRIMLDYAARNAILPNLTGFAMSLGFVLGGAILVEFVFNYQGVGWLLLQAVENTDYPLMQAL